jgi:hypothetical protein
MVEATADSAPLAAKWIAPPGEKRPNYTFLARQTFEVKRLPQKAILRIAADSRYVVYLNGRRVGNGPARGTDRHTFLDRYDVASGLRKGGNVLAVRVHCPVTPLNSAVPPVTPAVYVELAPFAASDASWQVRPDPTQRSDSLFYTHHIGYSDYRDLRREPVGWELFEDAPEGWEGAQEVSTGTDLGGRHLSPRPIPALNDDRYRPAHIVEAGNVPGHLPDIEADVEYARLMQMEMHNSPSGPRFEHLDALTRGGPARVLPAAAQLPKQRGEGAYLILDFGRELCGNILLDIEAEEGVIVDVGYDEAVVNGRVDTRRVNPNGTIYRFADRYILRGGRQRIENRLHDRGLRVVQLVLRRFSTPVTIHSVEVADRGYPLPLRASFECDQEFLNTLWQKSVATMAACSMDLFVDCPWREQSLWLDDYKQENIFYLNLTADPVFTAHNLRVTAEGAMPSGMMTARYPSERLCVLPVTSANWISVLADYYVYTGDLQLVRELLPVADKALSVYEGWKDKDGLVPDQTSPEMWNFVDWAYGDRLGGTTAALNVLVAGAYKRLAGLHEAVGDTARAEDLAAKASAMVTAIFRTFWLPEDNRLYDCTAPTDGRRSFSQLPHAMGISYHLFDAKQIEMALAAILDPQGIRAEYGYQLFVLKALAQNGRAAAALQIIHDLWGHMVRADSPTLWEVFDGRSSFTGVGSLCHGFTCAPVYFIQTALLGVWPLQPGFAEFALAPQSLGVLWARGGVPTPHGTIQVAWSSQEDQSLLAEVEIPAGTTAVLADGRRLAAGTHTITFAGCES